MNADRRRVLIARAGRSPHEVWLLGACVLAGSTGLASGAESNAVAAALPGWAQLLWYAGLLLWGTVALAGLAWRHRVEGLLIERAALVALTGLCLVYALGAIVYAGLPAAAVGAALTVAFALANVARARQISHDLAAHRR